jgi:hypothetical protein
MSESISRTGGQGRPDKSDDTVPTTPSASATEQEALDAGLDWLGGMAIWTPVAATPAAGSITCTEGETTGAWTAQDGLELIFAAPSDAVSSTLVLAASEPPASPPPPRNLAVEIAAHLAIPTLPPGLNISVEELKQYFEQYRQKAIDPDDPLESDALLTFVQMVFAFSKTINNTELAAAVPQKHEAHLFDLCKAIFSAPALLAEYWSTPYAAAAARKRKKRRN